MMIIIIIVVFSSICCWPVTIGDRPPSCHWLRQKLIIPLACRAQHPARDLKSITVTSATRRKWRIVCRLLRWRHHLGSEYYFALESMKKARAAATNDLAPAQSGHSGKSLVLPARYSPGGLAINDDLLTHYRLLILGLDLPLGPHCFGRIQFRQAS